MWHPGDDTRKLPSLSNPFKAQNKNIVERVSTNDVFATGKKKNGIEKILTNDVFATGKKKKKKVIEPISPILSPSKYLPYGDILYQSGQISNFNSLDQFTGLDPLLSPDSKLPSARKSTRQTTRSQRSTHRLEPLHRHSPNRDHRSKIDQLSNYGDRLLRSQDESLLKLKSTPYGTYSYNVPRCAQPRVNKLKDAQERLNQAWADAREVGVGKNHVGRFLNADRTPRPDTPTPDPTPVATPPRSASITNTMTRVSTVASTVALTDASEVLEEVEPPDPMIAASQKFEEELWFNRYISSTEPWNRTRYDYVVSMQQSAAEESERAQLHVRLTTPVPKPLPTLNNLFRRDDVPQLRRKPEASPPKLLTRKNQEQLLREAADMARAEEALLLEDEKFRRQKQPTSPRYPWSETIENKMNISNFLEMHIPKETELQKLELLESGPVKKEKKDTSPMEKILLKSQIIEPDTILIEVPKIEVETLKRKRSVIFAAQTFPKWAVIKIQRCWRNYVQLKEVGLGDTILKIEDLDVMPPKIFMSEDTAAIFIQKRWRGLDARKKVRKKKKKQTRKERAETLMQLMALADPAQRLEIMQRQGHWVSDSDDTPREVKKVTWNKDLKHEISKSPSVFTASSDDPEPPSPTKSDMGVQVDWNDVGVSIAAHLSIDCIDNHGNTVTDDTLQPVEPLLPEQAQQEPPIDDEAPLLSQDVLPSDEPQDHIPEPNTTDINKTNTLTLDNFQENVLDQESSSEEDSDDLSYESYTSDSSSDHIPHYTHSESKLPESNIQTYTSERSHSDGSLQDLRFTESSFSNDALNKKEGLLEQISENDTMLPQHVTSEDHYFVALYDFNPDDIKEWPFPNHLPLALNAGQVIELTAGDETSQWACGRLVSDPEQSGYFPMNYVLSMPDYRNLLNDLPDNESEISNNN